LPGPKKKENLKSSGWIVDRPADRLGRLVGHPDQASGSAGDAVGRSSGRRLVADRLGALLVLLIGHQLAPCF
jgi:hypothetical protein